MTWYMPATEFEARFDIAFFVFYLPGHVRDIECLNADGMIMLGHFEIGLCFKKVLVFLRVIHA